MISGSHTPAPNTCTSISTRSGIVKIRCLLPQQVFLDKRLVKEVQQRIKDRLTTTGTPFKSVHVTKSAPHGIEIKLSAKDWVPDWIEPYFKKLNYLVEQMGFDPAMAPGAAEKPLEYALPLSRLAKGLPLEEDDRLALYGYAAKLMHTGKPKLALTLLKRMPEADWIRGCPWVFEFYGQPISYEKLTSCADEQTVDELVHMVAVALRVTSRSPELHGYALSKLEATAERLHAPTLTPHEMQALDAKHGGLSVASTAPSGHAERGGIDIYSSSE